MSIHPHRLFGALAVALTPIAAPCVGQESRTPANTCIAVKTGQRPLVLPDNLRFVPLSRFTLVTEVGIAAAPLSDPGVLAIFEGDINDPTRIRTIERPSRIGPLSHGSKRILSFYEIDRRSLSAYHFDSDEVVSINVEISPISLLSRTDATVVVNAYIATPERAGYSLHIVDSQGSIAKSFDIVEPFGSVARPERNLRLLAPDNTGGVWIISPFHRLVARFAGDSIITGPFTLDLPEMGNKPERRVIGAVPLGDRLGLHVLHLNEGERPDPFRGSYLTTLETLERDSPTVSERLAFPFNVTGVISANVAYEKRLLAEGEIRVTIHYFDRWCPGTGDS